MIHYHGSPFSGKKIEADELCKALYSGTGGLVSFAHMSQVDLVMKHARHFVLDNGAFTTYNQLMNGKKPKTFNWSSHWTKYYAKVLSIYSRLDWFIIPDVIGGSESENDELIARVPTSLKSKAVPVWHTTESIDRFVRLCEQHERVCIGACGEHHYILGDACQNRLQQAFEEIYYRRNIDVKIHGLRMTDNRVVAKFPFDSCDSTKVVMCEKYSEKFQPEIKGRLNRTAIFRAMMEKTKSPTVDEWLNRQDFKLLKEFNQQDLFL